MALGYDGKLYILAFDHRGSFQKKMFGIEGDPTPEETERITDSKHLIYEGMVKATEIGSVQGDQVGVLVDEQFGGTVPRDAKVQLWFRGRDNAIAVCTACAADANAVRSFEWYTAGFKDGELAHKNCSVKPR